jgi:uncharacterized repeat protein (TIGR01451 family)
VPRIVLLAVIASAVLAQSAAAATVNVQNEHDSGNGSLRKAIADANPNDDVLVPPGIYRLTSGELDVGKNLQIIGAGSGTAPGGNTIVTAGGSSRVFNVHDGTVTLTDMRITGGKATPGAGIQESSVVNLERVTVAGNVAGGGNAPGQGGGIAVVNAGSVELHLLNSSVTGNRAGGGGPAGGGQGGGIHVQYGTGASRTITLDRSVVSGNTAGGVGGEGIGGGINTDTESNNSTLDLKINDSTIAGNVAGGGGGQGFGGGIEAGSGATGASLSIELNRTTVSGNRSGGADKTGNGGGIDFQSGGNNVDQTLTVSDSTIAGNATGGGGTLGTGIGGGINFSGSGSGGSKSMNLTHATIANNRAGGGGALASGGGMFNGAGTTTLHNSIVANSTSFNCSNPVAASSHSIEDANDCGLSAGSGDKPSTDPKLKPLGDYGGPTRTMLPRFDSPALDNAEGLYCTAMDQRAITRPQGSECDIGADEVQRADVAVKAGLTPKTTSTGRVVTYKFKVTNKGPQIAQGVTLVDKLPAKLKLVSVSGCTGKLGPGCRIGTLPFGATRTVTIKARPIHSGKLVNRGRVTTFGADPVPGNDSAATTLVALPSLESLSTRPPNAWHEGDKLRIRFKLRDPGQVTLSFSRKQNGKRHTVGSLKVKGHANKNEVVFDGKLDNGKTLSPGSYRLTARVTDSGGRKSPPRFLNLKLLS